MVGATPVLEVQRRQTPSPLGCIWWCYLNGTIIDSSGKVVDQITDQPGCSDCPGSACTGKLDGQLHMGNDIFVGDYWASVYSASVVQAFIPTLATVVRDALKSGLSRRRAEDRAAAKRHVIHSKSIRVIEV